MRDGYGSQDPEPNLAAGLIRTPLGWAIALGVAALGVYLFAAHTGHTLAAMPYLLLIACPLMHVFGHKHDHGHRDTR